MALRLKRREAIARRFFAVFGIIFASGGAFTLWMGLPAYPNYWGGVVFPWVGIVVGLLISVVCIFFPRLLKGSTGPSQPFGRPWEDGEW